MANPRWVRNFFTELRVDGKRGIVRTGPRRSGGGFSQSIYIRNQGSAELVLSICGSYDDDGKLTIDVCPLGGGRFQIIRYRDKPKKMKAKTPMEKLIRAVTCEPGS